MKKAVKFYVSYDERTRLHALQVAGWKKKEKTKQTRPFCYVTHIVFSKGAISIRIKIYAENNYTVRNYNDTMPCVVLMDIRTQKGGNKAVDLPFGDLPSLREVIDKLFEHGNKLAGTTPVADQRINLPEPYKFIQKKYRVKGAAVFSDSQLAMCEAIGIYTISSNLEMIEVDSAVETNLWFLMDARNHLGATFNFITDGDSFYPFDRYRKFVTTRTTPKRSVDLKKMNISDLALVTEAIRVFAETE